MIKSVHVSFSETGSFDLEAKGITIFVGPNNSGKSLVLREIEALLINGTMPLTNRIVSDFELDWPEPESVLQDLQKARALTPITVVPGNVHIGRFNPSGNREATELQIATVTHFIRERREKNWLSSQFVRWGVLRLDGRSRFDLTNDQVGGDLELAPQNVLAHLFQNAVARASVRTLVKEAFNLNLYIDPTNLGHLRIKLSSDLIPTDEQSLDEDARRFYKSATHIKEASDGVQAFTGIVTAVLSGEYHTILIDEPEAFLHPPLARRLGTNLAEIASKRNGTLMASTHSSDFLMGCVQASAKVKVIRLEYSEGRSRARTIDHASLMSFLKRPLMRSANVISGLFHDGVIVLESDNDRVFYSEIYYRLSAGKTDYPSILFVNAQNKQTIRDIIGPLREFGVPAAAIPDIDIVKDGGKGWTEWLRSAKIPDALHLGYGQQRAAIEASLRASGHDMKTSGGLDLLEGSDRLAADVFFDSLNAFGIFPVRRGELESWLPDLNVAGKKTDWAVAMLERLGSDINDSAYVKASTGDVWTFLDNIVSWIKNPSRKGTA